MPDFTVQLTYTTGQHEAVVKEVTVQDCRDANVAKMLGIEHLLKWADEDDCPFPNDALKYWRQQKNNGNVMIYELLSQLESAYNLTFTIHEVKDLAAPQAEAPKRNKPQTAQRNGASPAAHKPFDLKTMLADQLTELQARQKELQSERRRIDDEYSDNAASIADIRNFMLVSATKRPKRRVKVEAENVAAEA